MNEVMAANHRVLHPGNRVDVLKRRSAVTAIAVPQGLVPPRQLKCRSHRCQSSIAVQPCGRHEASPNE
jgi:hypothetical protein